MKRLAGFLARTDNQKRKERENEEFGERTADEIYYASM